MKKVISLVLALCMVFALVAVSASADDKVYTLKLGSNTAASNPENIYAYKLAELVKEASNGKVIIEVYDSAQLGDHLERLEGLKMGTLDMTLTSIGFLGGYDPVFNIFEMPYLFVSDEHQHAVYNGSVREMLDADCAANGFVLVDCLEQGARHITNNVRPVNTPEDLTGIKLRVPDTTSSMDALSAMGATPTPLAFSELYLALQQGTVDGQENPLATSFSGKFQEVQKYLSLTGHQRIEQILVCSDTSWNKLPEEYRAIIDECKAEANEFMLSGIFAEQENIINEFKAAGVEVNDVDVELFVNKVLESGLREKYVEQYGEKAQAYFDAIDALK